jgi:hypothetical protein
MDFGIADHGERAGRELGSHRGLKSDITPYLIARRRTNVAYTPLAPPNVRFQRNKPHAISSPVAPIGRTPFVIVVNPTFPIKSVPELIDYAKANPGKINIASAGLGTRTACRLRAVQDDDRRRHGSGTL